MEERSTCVVFANDGLVIVGVFSWGQGSYFRFAGGLDPVFKTGAGTCPPRTDTAGGLSVLDANGERIPRHIYRSRFDRVEECRLQGAQHIANPAGVV